MIEPEDLIIPGNLSIHNRLAFDALGAFDRAAAETITVRLSQLESRPVVGTYDALHLQQIHARIFDGVFPWAGKLREPQSSDLASSLDMLFDKLARENRLKGLDGDAWSKRSTEYFREITAIEPFTDGNDLASIELFRQLAGENNMTLDVLRDPLRDKHPAQIHATQTSNLRRIIMLGIDPYPSCTRPRHGTEERNAPELNDFP